MTGIDKIIRRIEEDAQKEAERIMDAARVKSEETAGEYQKKAEALALELNNKSVCEATEHRRRATGVAELEARKKLLETKQDMIAEVFGAAKSRLAELPKAEKVPLLARLAADASRTGKEEILLTKSERESIGADVTAAANKLLGDGKKPSGLTLSEKVITDETGGLILSGGEVEVNCTFGALLETLRGEMTSEIAAVLFA